MAKLQDGVNGRISRKPAPAHPVLNQCHPWRVFYSDLGLMRWDRSLDVLTIPDFFLRYIVELSGAALRKDATIWVADYRDSGGKRLTQTR
jgi:hypothetical protein